METFHLNPTDVPVHLKGLYAGKQFKIQVGERVTIPSTAGLWDGGSRETYRLVRLTDGAEIPASDNMSAPWDKARQDRVVTLESGVTVVKHSVFCGRDMGLTFFVHPNDAARLLPPSVDDLSDTERKVLNITSGYKSAYRADELRRQSVSPADHEAARASLIAKGLLNRAGAITVAGRNARSVR